MPRKRLSLFALLVVTALFVAACNTTPGPSAPSYTLTVTATNGTVTSTPANINCGSACSAKFPAATKVTLTPTPASGYIFDSWSGDCSGNSSCSVTMNADKKVTAVFKPTTATTYTLNVTATNGTVTSTPAGINCGSTCSADFADATEVTLTPTPASGYSFDSWSGDCSGSAACSVTMDADKAVTANFVTTTPGTGGSVTAQVAASSDDAEQFLEVAVGKSFPINSVYTESDDLDITNDNVTSSTRERRGNQLIGLRFANVAIPAGKTIKSAYIQFTANATSSGTDLNGQPLTFTLKGELSSTAAPFENMKVGGISDRTTTTAAVDWAPPAWTANEAAAAEQSADVSTILQEIVGLTSWDPANNGVVFIISGPPDTDPQLVRRAKAYDLDPTAAPKLVVEFE